MKYKGKEITPEILKRFHKKYEKTVTCWNWTGWKQYYGYGGFDLKPLKIRAHILMYLITKGKIPKDCEICHSCDNPSCVNPDHLEAKTHKENLMDMSKRGRAANTRGEKSGMAKLTWNKVNLIRKEYDPKTNSSRKLAKKYKVSKDTILYVVKHYTWKHI